MRYIPYVNTKMGTKSVMRFSNGNTLPLTQRPFGMVSFCPQSDGSSRWLYTPDFPYIEGIRLTHQPSPWIGDYGTVLFTPQSDVIADTPSLAWSGYRISEAENRPDYLKVRFLRSECDFELTPTKRGCAIRLSSDSDKQLYFSLLPTQGNYTYTLDSERGILYGTSDAHSQDDAKDFKMYFVLKLCPEELDTKNTIIGESYVHLALKTKKAQICVAISYISHEQAMLNLDREIDGRDFELLLNEAICDWEEHLGRIEIEAQHEEQMRTFYSCLYRTMLFPHTAYELDENEKPIHYSPCDGKIREGVRYTDSGAWDTYRTLYPLYTLICRDEYREIVEGFVNDYEEGGFLPRWPSIGEVGCMPSTLVDAVIAEAVTQKIIDEPLAKRALDGMLHHASTPSPEKRYGREGIAEYIKYGYVPCDLYKESVNLTLDFAYGDWCISQIAKNLGLDSIATEYEKRSMSYTHLFDSETGFMRGRATDGSLRESFDPLMWGGDYTEACAWQSTLAVQHDLDGLSVLLGEKEKLLSYLDKLFKAPPLYRVHGYGGEIHEMTEMASVDFGQCAISNQPSFHIPYIYAYLGETAKSEYWVGRICSELFKSTPDGYPGDEDNGSMSAWYILSCLGIYRMCPGKDEWIRIKPLVKSAKILGKQIF